MELSYMKDFRFNDVNHKQNFFNYMFAASKNQMAKHEYEDFFIYVNGKPIFTDGQEGLKNRKTAVEILCKKEINLQKLQKSVVMYLENISEHEEQTLDKCFERLCEYIQKAADKTENITYVCAVSHFTQIEQCPHIHILYASKEDIEDELQKLFYLEMENLNNS